ncbi:hypothetical protein P153DRAFT_356027 [Dothidotthia symphoricarpi CBS 119687]|uniref:MARVEL domain-containing protein n=1 Tax=Dothidotthia symphoricarpi CBS 119687 TaxID=1392245 RepID=A0A6A6AIG8_9PLEO|nr:uncharacterized protein P153DRAFT_356027 [Dothidotthia symphoricarpi CBS 119687]KAF2130221.1 hypothetical protein P153DRAFT_356027 [Dothidotthia symphoricarpi CBS 119687]
MAQQPTAWKKRILVPFWIVRICMMILIIAAYAWSLRALSDIQDVVKPAVGSVVVFMLLILIVLLIDVLAIVLFLRNALKPGTFLTMNCFQTGFWGGVVIMDFAAIADGASTASLGFSIFVFATFLGLLIYAIIGYNRAKKQSQRGNYTPAHNPAAPAPSAYPPPYQGAPPYQQNTAYYAQTGQPIELQGNQYLPPYQAGPATEFYQTQPLKPAHMA